MPVDASSGACFKKCGYMVASGVSATDAGCKQ